jgi:hypothetical protein
VIPQAVESAVPAENASRLQQPLGKPADGFPTAPTTSTTMMGYSRCPSKRGRSGTPRFAVRSRHPVRSAG